MHKYYNPNPQAARVGDCVIRAVSFATGQSWEKTYLDLCVYGLIYCDLPSSNGVWSRYLLDKGFRRYIVPDTCPSCYTVRQFTEDHPKGEYILAISGHVVAVKDGNHYDTWDSSDEVVVYYWMKE
ncbi:MAG: hypothetical protein MJ097_00700 [Dorea sp.]|nr:hypothetical protein [Dorea sp.]